MSKSNSLKDFLSCCWHKTFCLACCLFRNNNKFSFFWGGGGVASLFVKLKIYCEIVRGNIHSMSSCIKQVWLVMLINFCLLHLPCLGSLCWLSATVSSERATSSLSGAGGNFLHTSNWTKCLSNSEPSYTDQIIIQTRCQQRFFTSLFLFCSLRRLLVDFMILPGLFKLPNA